MVWIVIKLFFRRRFFLRFIAFAFPPLYFNNRYELMIYIILFIVFGTSFYNLDNEKYFWDNRINILTEINIGTYVLAINSSNFFFISLYFLLAIFINIIFNKINIVLFTNIVDFCNMLLFSTFIGNYIYYYFSKIKNFYGKKLVKYLIFILLFNIVVLIIGTKIYLHILFLLSILILYFLQINYFKKSIYYKSNDTAN